MSRKNTKQTSFTNAVKKSVGKRVWGNLSASDRAIVHDFAKLERMGGTVGSSVPKEDRQAARQA